MCIEGRSSDMYRNPGIEMEAKFKEETGKMAEIK